MCGTSHCRFDPRALHFRHRGGQGLLRVISHWPIGFALTLIVKPGFKLCIQDADAWSAAQARWLAQNSTACVMRCAREADRTMAYISKNLWRRSTRSLALSAVLTLCACAPNSPELGSRHDPPRASAIASEHPEPQLCRPDRALLVPPRAPDCGFGRSDLKTLDPEQWTRLKIEYERKCYQIAEKAVRERLRLLQAANRCDANAARS
jgi:hypothetical protein